MLVRSGIVFVRSSQKNDSLRTACSSYLSSLTSSTTLRRCYSTSPASLPDDPPTPTVSIDPFTWKDTAFSVSKRDELGLRGLLPPTHNTLEQQIERTLHQLRSKKVRSRTALYKMNSAHVHLLACRLIWESTSFSPHYVKQMCASSTPPSCRMQKSVCP